MRGDRHRRLEPHLSDRMAKPAVRFAPQPVHSQLRYLFRRAQTGPARIEQRKHIAKESTHLPTLAAGHLPFCGREIHDNTAIGHH